MSKTICLYHANCFDGMAAAWVVYKAYPEAEFIPASYGDHKLINSIQQDCYENANINDSYIIVDFSFPRQLMIDMNNKAKAMIVLDHHKTAEEACSGLNFCRFDMNESGASLAWKYFFSNEPVPLVIQYVADRDLWKFELIASEAINSFIQSFPLELKTYEMLYTMLDHDLGFERAIQGGRSILRYKKTMTKMQSQAVIFIEFTRSLPGIKIPVCNATMLFSEVGSLLCEQYHEAPFAAYYADKPGDIRQWGLRSIGDFDVSTIAKVYGGGGHKNAAGFIQKLSPILDVL